MPLRGSRGADTKLCMKEIDPEILENTRVFHVGSLSLTDDPSRTATYEAINIARNSGAVISLRSELPGGALE